MNRYRALALLLVASVVAGCDKNTFDDITVPPAASRIRFFNFGVGAPNVNFYANTTKITAVTSATGVESVLGVAYGGVGSGGFYSAIAPGQYTLTGKLSDTATKDIVISTVSATIADGKFYSYYLSGIYNATTRLAEGFVVQDAFVSDTTDYSTAYVRFVNAISNSSPMTLYAKNTTTAVEVPVGGLIAYQSAGAFTAIPNGAYDLGARVAGATTNTITRTAVSFVAGRIYTIGARGDITITSTTAATRPILDFTTNR